MIPVDTIIVFFTASVALGMAPGPDNIFVLTQSMLHGSKAGLLVTLGLCTGLLVHTAAVALGVAAIFQTSEIAFNLLKIVGAAYLLYLAWMAFRAGAVSLDRPGADKIKMSGLYRRGIILNISNPKVAIFFLAFLPQFAVPENGSLTMQILMLGVLFMLSTLLVFGAVAASAGFVGNNLKKSPRAQIIMNRVAGTVFAAMAIRLATVQR